MIAIKKCGLCPRNCGTDRTQYEGPCKGGSTVKIARAALHHWEEPCISGSNGSGTVFFSGCPLQCCFCQNYQISAQNFGKEVGVERLAEIFLELQQAGAHNINLVSPTQYAPWIVQALRLAKPQLKIPVICNSGGYERIATLRLLESMVDAYLPDLKYFNPAVAMRYSSAEDYFEAAAAAISEMVRQAGPPRFDGDGLLQSGVIIRHLVLPNGVHDSIQILDWIARTFGKDEVLLSLMSQYTPTYHSAQFPEINRRVSTYEYNRVLSHAQELGLQGYMQERSAAREGYTPPFDLQGV